jgi:parallel beta-helix repeat protein
MERRKFLIGAGTLGAGASVALGTGAFTTVEAQRNVDIGVAGDANAQLAIQEVSGANAELVSTKDDGTLSLSIPDVNQDAVTEVEDLFRLVNQGTQSVSLYFQDDSDAVTFRVTRSTQSLEGADKSVQLGIGEQVVVGLTINTLDNDVSGTLLDSVTIVADASASAPAQSGPQPQYVVDGTGDGPNTFATLSAALNANDVTAGSVIGVDGAATVNENGPVDVDLNGVTVTGFNGTPTIQTPDLGGGVNFITVPSDATDVAIKNVNIRADNSGGDAATSLAVNGDNALLDGVVFNDTESPQGNPPVTVGGANPTVRNCKINNGVISAGGTGLVTLVNNTISGSVDEGIFSTSNANFVLENNRVEDHNAGGRNSKEIKLTNPSQVNGEDATAGQVEAVLTENSVNSVQISGEVGTRATPDAVGTDAQFESVNEVLSPGAQGGSQGAQDALVALFEAGEYDAFEKPVVLNKPGALIKGLGRPRLKYDGGYPGGGITFSADGISVENIEIDFLGNSNDDSKVNFSGGSGLVDVGSSDVTFRNAALNAVFVEEDGSINFDTKGGLSLGDTVGASFINVDIGILNRQAGRPLSLDRGRPGGFFVIGQEIRDCTLRGGLKIATGNVTAPTIVNNIITDVANSESLAIDSSATSAVVRGNSIEYNPDDPRIGKAFDGAEIRMESDTTTVNVQENGGGDLADAQAVANELSEANSGSQLASGNAVVVNRSTDPNTRAP